MKKFTIPVYLQSSLNAESYTPKTTITLSEIPENRYVGQFTCYYDENFSGERDVIVVLSGDGARAGVYTDSQFGKDVINKGFVVIEPVEPTISITGDLNKESPFPAISSIVNNDPRHLMRSRGGHIHKAIITGLIEIERRSNLSAENSEHVPFSLSGKYTFLCQSRGSRTGFYLANCQLTYPSGISDKIKYLDRVDYWFLAGFPFDTTGNSIADNPVQSTMVFSNMLSTTPRKSNLIICANDTDNLTGSDIRRLLMYSVPDKRREDLFFVNTEENGHYTHGSTQLEFLDSVANDRPITLVFTNSPNTKKPLVNLLGEQAKKSSEVYPTPRFTI